jgi:hypothetical protein
VPLVIEGFSCLLLNDQDMQWPLFRDLFSGRVRSAKKRKFEFHLQELRRTNAFRFEILSGLDKSSDRGKSIYIRDPLRSRSPQGVIWNSPRYRPKVHIRSRQKHLSSRSIQVEIISGHYLKLTYRKYRKLSTGNCAQNSLSAAYLPKYFGVSMFKIRDSNISTQA